MAISSVVALMTMGVSHGAHEVCWRAGGRLRDAAQVAFQGHDRAASLGSPHSVEIGPHSVDDRPHEAGSEPMFAEVGRRRANFSRNRATLSRTRASLADPGPMLADNGQILGLGCVGPHTKPNSGQTPSIPG